MDVVERSNRRNIVYRTGRRYDFIRSSAFADRSRYTRILRSVRIRVRKVGEIISAPLLPLKYDEFVPTHGTPARGSVRRLGQRVEPIDVINATTHENSRKLSSAYAWMKRRQKDHFRSVQLFEVVTFVAPIAGKDEPNIIQRGKIAGSSFRTFPEPHDDDLKRPGLG